MTENGPFRVTNNGSNLVMNPQSWNTNRNVLWVDQPVGTGFSYVQDSRGYVVDEQEVAMEMYTFLQGFLAMHPEYAKLPFWIAAESYGGHYAPAVANYIAQQNLKKAGPIMIDLQGIMIGNGMTQPEIQYGAYGEYAYGHGMIDYPTYEKVQSQYAACAALIGKGDFTDANTACNGIFDTIEDAAGPFNVYDVTKPCIGSLCYDFTAVTNYFNRLDVFAAWNTMPKNSWETCDGTVYNRIVKGDWFVSQRKVIPFLLQNQIEVLVYNGNLDFICNFIGSESWVRTMVWPGTSAYNAASRQMWFENGLINGYLKEYQNLHMLVVNNAGHMVPMDQPLVARLMMERFTSKQPIVPPSTME